ncbi:MAG: sulfotransferase domain-containing protein [Acidimicrobiia bacterium]|nr:sulfotransferase domain-containing protein [Acidimicrobiia bacterium]
MREYREDDADNARWLGFAFRPGDVVVDAPSKSGTTWTQLLAALVVFDGPAFPAPLSRLSPWLEQTTRSVEEVHRMLDTQEHRRIIKSHTPLDGVPLRDEVRYVCVGRDPRDAAESMLHHADNMDRRRFAELIGRDFEPTPVRTHSERIDRFLDGEEFPGWNLRFLLHHYRTFWDARDRDNVALFHFADYRSDLPVELGRLAEHLEIPLTSTRARELAAEAAIDRVRDRAADVAPEAHMGIWKDTARFFRRGTGGEWRGSWTPEQQTRYDRIVAAEAAPDLAAWVHGGRTAG